MNLLATIRNTIASASLALIALTGATGCSGMKNGDMAKVAPLTANDRVGSVYLLRGWIGVFSTGIDSLGTQIADAGIHSEVYQEAQWSKLADTIIAKYESEPNHEPIVIIGHSYGADDSILITRRLAEHNIKVDLVVTLDPVTPKKVPSNVNLVYNLYQSNGALDNLPWLRGIALTADTPGPMALKNMNIRTDRTDLLDDGNIDHFNIEKKPKIHQDVIAQVMQVCQPRPQWLASRGLKTPVLAAATPSAKPAAVPAKPAGAPIAGAAPGVTITSFAAASANDR